MRIYLIIIALVLLTGCSSKPDVINYPDTFSGLGKQKVYIVSHGWHTGFVIKAEEVLRIIPELKERFTDAEYIEFGWGDEGFYRAKEITSILTLKAILWLTDSIVHSVAVPVNVSKYFANSEVESICMNDSELSSLIRFIQNSFQADHNGNIQQLEHGIYGDSQFYKGAGKYYLMNTCNKWTAKGLKSAGMDINPAFKLTSDSIMNYVRAFNKELAITSPLWSNACR